MTVTVHHRDRDRDRPTPFCIPTNRMKGTYFFFNSDFQNLNFVKICMNLHARILHQFPLFDKRFLIFLVEKPLNIPKLKKVMTYLFSF